MTVINQTICLNPNWEFSNVSYSPKILNLNSFGNSRGNSHTLGIKFPFTCGKSWRYNTKKE